MRIRKIRTNRFVFVVILTLIVSVSCTFDLLGNNVDEGAIDPICQYNKNINLNNLLINNENLPSGWHLGEEGIGIEDDRSFDSAGSYYFTDEYQDQFPRLITQMIYRHNTLESAKKDFLYGISNTPANAELPSSWDFQSMIADESGIICRNEYCNWVARYDCIVVDIVGRSYLGYSTLEDMENIVRLVDESAGELIDLSEK